jgi:hypothetical protein
MYEYGAMCARPALSGRVEFHRDHGVDAHSEVIHEDLFLERRLAGVSASMRSELPTIQLLRGQIRSQNAAGPALNTERQLQVLAYLRLRVAHVEQTGGEVVCISSAAPTQGPGQVVASTQRKNSNRRSLI